jgi:hypothetical protein
MSTPKQLQAYKDAVWSYLLEHCDLTERGHLFVKFHTNSREEFEKHVAARWLYGYHRGDPKAKEAEHQEMRFQLEREKYEAEIRHLKNKLRGRRMLVFKSFLKKLHLP